MKTIRPLQPQAVEGTISEDEKMMQLLLTRPRQSLLDRAHYHLWRTRTAYGSALPRPDRIAMEVLKNLSNGISPFFGIEWTYQQIERNKRKI